MKAADADIEQLVTAAQAGDKTALATLVSRHLPLVYNIVGRAMDNRADVDDVVQETMLRVVRDLPDLRSPSSFRSWLVAITLHQTSYRNRVRQSAEQRRSDLAGEELPDPNGDFTDLTILRLGLSGQRRTIVEAGRWLDDDARELLSLWWLEKAGHLTRAELADALHISTAHAGVRVQRTLDQLESARTLVEALTAADRCPGLSEAAAGWDGVPTSRWRKRLLRHVRDCPRCGSFQASLIPPDRLLAGLGLVPVPAALTDALARSTGYLPSAANVRTPGQPDGGPGALSASGRIGPAMPMKPVLAVVGIVAAIGAAYLAWPDAGPAPTEPTVAIPAGEPRTPGVPSRTAPNTSPAVKVPPSSSASSSAPALRRGVRALRSSDTGLYVASPYYWVDLVAIDGSSSPEQRSAVSYSVVRGLAKSSCYSFRTADGRYLRHYNWRLVLHESDGTQIFRGDATFCARAGASPGSWRFESANYPGHFLHHRDTELWVGEDDGTDSFSGRSTFQLGQVP